MRSRLSWWIAGFLLIGVFGYWLAGTAVLDPGRPAEAATGSAPRATQQADDPPPQFRRQSRTQSVPSDHDAIAAGAIEGERVILFKSRETLERFLARMGEDLRLLGRLHALNAIRIGFSNIDDLSRLLDGDESLAMIFPVTTPPLPEGSVQAGAVALGGGLLDWLGVTGDNSAFGRGVKIAILDTGVAAHPAFQSLIRSINLVDMPGDLAILNGHGTAVASMIIGNGSMTPGVAPGADIISVRVANDRGISDSFLLAQGIVAAVDAGARLINISMGSLGRSSVLDGAVTYAMERGALIFAAVGNNGIGQVYYPAANEGVIAVGAVDASGRHLDFSNTGNQVSVTAPGYALNAAWPGGQAAMVSGTSFSTPIVVGTVAAVMTEGSTGTLTPAQAWQRINRHLNDAGSPGADPQYGGGMPDLGRVLTAGQPGIHDAAVASQSVLPPDPGNPYGQIEILIQNRGTERLVNTAVRINADGISSTRNLTTLAPNAVATVRVPITRPMAENTQPFQVDASVALSGGIVDAKPSNDRRIEAHSPADPQ